MAKVDGPAPFGDRYAEVNKRKRHDLTTHRLHLDLNPPATPLPVQVDIKHIRHAISALLHNAMQFTAPGGTVSVSGRQNDGIASISVTDTGRGIAPEQLPLLFAPFEQIDRMEQVGGLGLGLILTKGVVESHGGHVTASSAGLGHGSTFTITLPLRGIVT